MKANLTCRVNSRSATTEKPCLETPEKQEREGEGKEGEKEGERGREAGQVFSYPLIFSY